MLEKIKINLRHVNKELIIFINFIESLIISVISMNFYLANYKIDKIYGVKVLPIEFSAILLLISSIFLITTNIYLVLKFDKKSENEKQKIITSLRKQRHEFINHLETLNYFLDNEFYENARSYLDKIGVIINSQSQLQRINNLAFESVINNYIVKSEAKNIFFEFNSNSNLSKLPLSPVHITNIFSNLLKNALENNDENGIISVEAIETKQDYIFTITNTGKPISKYLNLFEPGETTNGNGRGYGLSVVKEILDKYNNATIEIEDYDTPTIKIVINKEE